MKRFILSLVAIIATLSLFIYAEKVMVDLSDFGSVDSTYKDHTADIDGIEWTVKSAALAEVTESGTSFSYKNSGKDITANAVILTGKSGGQGSLTSDLIDEGIKSISFNYGFGFSEKNASWEIDLSITVTPQNGEPITDNLVESGLTQYAINSYSHDFNVSGPCTIEIKNNKTYDKNYSRAFIWNLEYTTISNSPEISPESGTFSKAVTVTLDYEDATIYYTLDGSEPTAESEEYTEPFSIAPSIDPVIVKAIAIDADGTESDIVTATYEFALGLPVFTPEGGVISEETVSVSIAPAEGEEATIYYTLDGSTPTTESDVYSEPLTISETTVVNAIAYNDPLTSEVTSQVYQFGVTNNVTEANLGIFNDGNTNTAYTNYPQDGQSVPEGWSAKNVAILCGSSSGIVENYTKYPFISNSESTRAIVLNGKVGAEGQLTTGVINGGIGQILFKYGYPFGDKKLDFTVKVVKAEATQRSEEVVFEKQIEGTIEQQTAYMEVLDVNTSDDVYITFTNNGPSHKSSGNADRVAIWDLGWTSNGEIALLAPEISPADGTTFTSSDTIQITNRTEGADVYYTTDGTIPSKTNGILYDGLPIIIYDTTTIRAIAYRGKGENEEHSEVVSATYTLDFTATITPDGGTFYEPVTVSLGASHMNENVKIYYTLNGNDPTESSEFYTGPFPISESTTVKAIAIETIFSEEDNEGELEKVVSKPASAEFIIEAPKETFHSFAEIFAYYNAQQANGQKMDYINKASNVVKIDFITNVAAVSDKYLYLDDTFETGELASMPIVNNSNIDWTTLYAEGDELAGGWVVSFKWEQKVVPTLVLAGQPAKLVDVPSGAIIPTDTLTVAQVNASAAWNSEDIYYATEHNKVMSSEQNPRYVPVPNIALNNPDLSAGLVYVKDVNFSKTTKANTGSNPTRNFTGTSDGESLKFVTRFPIDAYSAGTYNVRGILSYETVIKKEKVDEIGDITQEADTIVSAVVYPLELIAVDPDHGGVVETGNEKFVPAETVTVGDVVIVAPETDSNGDVQSGFAFSPLPTNDDKPFGYMPYYRASFAGDTVIVTATQIVTLTVSDYTDGTNAEYYYMQDSYGRYIYQKDDYNSFNVTYDLPTEEAQLKAYSWDFAIDENTGDVVITNVEKGKWIQYSTKYNSFGCYPSTQDQSIMPKLYVKAEDDNTSAIEKVEVEVDGPAEIFNIQGIRMPEGANLPAGLYIVRRGSTVTKIIVR